MRKLRESLARDFVLADWAAMEVYEAYAEMLLFSQSSGCPIGQNDLWIAACAMTAGATLVTTDGDFDHLAGPYIQRILVDPLTGRIVE